MNYSSLLPCIFISCHTWRLSHCWRFSLLWFPVFWTCMEVFRRGLFHYNVARPRQDYEEKFENAVLFFFDQAHRPHSENPSRERSSSNRRNLKNPAFLFLVDGKHFANGVSDNDVITIISWFPCPSLAQTRIQNTGDCCFLNSSGLLFTESILCVFVVKPPFSYSFDVLWA